GGISPRAKTTSEGQWKTFQRKKIIPEKGMQVKKHTEPGRSRENKEGLILMKLVDTYHQYEQIMKMKPSRKRDLLLTKLMTKMEREYQIPLRRDPEWERKNPEVISLYRQISRSRTF